MPANVDDVKAASFAFPSQEMLLIVFGSHAIQKIHLKQNDNDYKAKTSCSGPGVLLQK
jgi:hypothetical protein